LVYFFLFWMLIEFGIFFPLLNAHRIWYIFSSSECSSNLVFGTFFSTSECSIISLKNWIQNSLGYGFFDSVWNI
jgi:hypothetical protein